MASNVFVGLICFGPIANVKAPIVPHDPIRINSNAELASIAGIEGWDGDGSPGDPYIIEGYDINGSGYGYCIFIGNTTYNFVIRDSYLHEASGVGNWLYFPNAGVNLFNVQNGTINNNTVSLNDGPGIRLRESCSNNIIINNTCPNNKYGIQFWSSSQNTIANNNASSKNNYGISLFDSPHNKITNNTASSNKYEGIHLSDSINTTITNNTISSNGYDGLNMYGSIGNTITHNEMVENGILLRGDVLEHWNSHVIDTTNTVNGKPVYYWRNQTGGTVPPGAGQVILANCTNVVVENQNVSKGVVAIELGFSYHNIVANNTVSNKEKGYSAIYLKYSSNNSITGNNASNNNNGILLDRSNDNIIANNTASSNYWAGIHLTYSRDNTVINNTAFSSNLSGILLTYSENNTITENNASKNDYGIRLDDSINNTLTNNTVFMNNDRGMILVDSSDNIIYRNNFIDNMDQAIDFQGANYWDNGYPLGGNYWSDYNGVDNFKGPNQDMPGSDGIGDSLYNIDSIAKDYYPLMEPGAFIPLENSMILEEGWNLISIPTIQENQSLKKVLEMINGYYDAVQWYDNSDTPDPWKHNKTGKSFGNDLSRLNETMSFWIHITHPGETIFIYNGTQSMDNQTVQLYPGWNMVGYPTPTTYNRTDGLNNLTFGSNVDAVQWYDAAIKIWHFMDSDDLFVPGRGYWVHSRVKASWKVPI